MRFLAKRGDTVAWVDDPFDPATDEVELRRPDHEPVRVRWQSALKFGYWEDDPE